jgi:ribose transport system substrate-binding protein
VLDAHTDPQAQVNQAENLVSQKVNAIIVSPWDTDTGSQVVAIARKANIPVFVADIGSKDTNYTSFVVSDNYQGGVKAADLLAKVAKGKSVAVLELQAGSVVAGQRHVGFKDQAKKVGLNIVASQPADSQRSLGMSVMENMLTAHPDIAGVFADNDEMALGALQALEAAGKNDIPVIGFDANGDALKAINDGKMLATMAQFPEKMGATSVQNAVKAAKGEKVEKDVKLDVEVVTKDNVAQFLK